MECGNIGLFEKEKYIIIKDEKILVGQYPSTGAWYCKELPASGVEELDIIMNKVIKILNKYNIDSGNEVKKEKEKK